MINKDKNNTLKLSSKHTWNRKLEFWWDVNLIERSDHFANLITKIVTRLIIISLVFYR